MEQILALYKSTESRLNSTMVIDLVKKATAHKAIFGFAEFYVPLRAKQQQLLQQASATQDDSVVPLSALANAWIDILEVFTYGTWSDYEALRHKHEGADAMGTAQFPELSAAQAKKLRQLTLVTLASGSETLAYGAISGALGVAETEVEGIVIDTIYAELLEARLDTQRRTVRVLGVAGRDASAARLEEIGAILEDWDALALGLLRRTQVGIDKSKQHVSTKAVKDKVSVR